MTRVKRKISKAERDRLDAERDARLDAWERWRDQVHEKEFQAKITSWDRLRGEGLVFVPALNATFEIYACNLPGRRTWYPETACVFYDKGVSITVKFDVSYPRTVVIGVTPGTPDDDKWARLDHDKLAFRCDDTGRAVTGWLP